MEKLFEPIEVNGQITMRRSVTSDKYYFKQNDSEEIVDFTVSVVEPTSIDPDYSLNLPQYLINHFLKAYDNEYPPNRDKLVLFSTRFYPYIPL